MSEELIKQIFSKAKLARLSEKKKDLIKAEILRFMEKNPLEVKKPGFWNVILAFKPKPVYISISVLALAFLTAGVVSTEAQSSLPGDALYPVKVGVNEKILQVMAFSDQAKLDLNIKLAEVRLQEAEKLAIEGNITETSQQEIKNNFNDKASEVAKTIQNMSDQKNYGTAAKIASDFEASLKAHNTILEKISQTKEKNDNTKEKINSIITEVASAAQKTTDSNRDSMEKEIDSEKDGAQKKIAERQMQAAEDALSEAKSLVEYEKDRINSDTMGQMQENLTLAEQKINDGKEKISQDSKDYMGAIVLFQQALITAKQSENLIKARASLKMDSEEKKDRYIQGR